MIKFTRLPFKIDQVFLTSDTHYGHANICSASTSWDFPHNSQCRQFDSLESMNERIVDNINSMVSEHDLLIHCGDWSFGGAENITTFRKKILCKNIILLQGNHDHNINVDHVSLEIFSNFQQIGYFQIESLQFICCHYPMSIWYQSHKNVPMFYGHVHGSFENRGKSLDVGIDNIFNIKKRYEPISLKEAYAITAKKSAFLESHHV